MVRIHLFANPSLLLENFRKFGNFRGNCAGRTYFFNFILEKGGKKTRQISIPPSVMCLTEKKKENGKRREEKRRRKKKRQGRKSENLLLKEG